MMSTDPAKAFRRRALAKAKACCCRKFLLFPLLPFELRLKIWIAALPTRPRILFFTKSNFLARWTYGLLGACRESNQVVLKSLPGSILTFDDITGSWRLPRLSIDPDLDTFYLRWEQVLNLAQSFPKEEPLVHLRHITTFAQDFMWFNTWRERLRQCTNLQTITLIVQLAGCGGRFELYDLVNGPDPLRPTLTPISIRVPQEQETRADLMEPWPSSLVLRAYNSIQSVLARMQQDFDQGLLLRVPKIHLKGMKYPQRERYDWSLIKTWLDGVLEFQILVRSYQRKITRKACSVCPIDRPKPLYKLYPVFKRVPQLPVSLWENIWKLAAPAKELENIESFFANCGEGIKSLGPIESLQLRAHTFNSRSRMITIGLFEADQQSYSANTIRFHAEDIFNFWDMSKWRTLGWSRIRIVSWDGDTSFAWKIKKVEMKSEDVLSVREFASSEVALKMAALDEIVVLRKILGSNLTFRYITHF